jgi:hypothetical protein
VALPAVAKLASKNIEPPAITGAMSLFMG